MQHASSKSLGFALVIGLAGVLVGSMDRALAQQTFDEWLKQDQAAFQQYKAEVTKEYQDWLEKDRKAFQEFVKEAGGKWGKDNVWTPQVKTWVQYTTDLEERSAVDFERGVARVQVLIDSEADVSPEDIKAAIQDGIQRVVLSGTLDPVDMISQQMSGTVAKDAPRRRTLNEIPSFSSYKIQAGDTVWGLARRFDILEPDLNKLNRMQPGTSLPSGKKILVPFVDPAKRTAVIGASANPILDRQVRMADGRPVSKDNAAEYARERVAAQPPVLAPVTRDDGKKVREATVEFKLAPDHLKVRAEKYLPLVSRYASKFELDPSLVFALIHTESAFNPRARSGVPAYGLMQLVPQSGGRDAYQLVYGEDKLVTGPYLFEPKNNIELGTALLRVIGTRYLKAVQDPKSRMYCTIAAYNTGAGNVCKAFGNTTSVSRAAPIINGMTPEEVYGRLKSNLPYEETRNYVVRVTERMPLYR